MKFYKSIQKNKYENEYWYFVFIQETPNPLDTDEKPWWQGLLYKPGIDLSTIKMSIVNPTGFVAIAEKIYMAEIKKLTNKLIYDNT